MPFDDFDLEAAVQSLTETLKNTADASEKELSDFVRAAIALDIAYMQRSGVTEGEPYDEDGAYKNLVSGLKKKFPRLAHLTEDFADAWEEYLDQMGFIEWE